MVSTGNMEKVSKAIHSQDEPLEKRQPTAPFALVGLSYLLILALCALGIGSGNLVDEIRDTIQQHFVADRNGKRLYSYATDG